MKTTTWISSVWLAMGFAFLIPVDDLIAEEPTTSTLIRQAAVKVEADEAATSIQWSRLAPENGKPFNDPFSRLTQDQLAELSLVARVRRLISEEKIGPDGPDANEAAKISGELKKQGVDVGWLLVQRERIPQIREHQIKAVSESVAKSLESTIVTVKGYATPVRWVNGLVVEILVVPTFAMCTHETEPSPLHVISVKNDEGFSLRQKDTPVRVTGVLSAEPKSTPLVTASGAQSFVSAYKIVPSNIEILTPTRRPSKTFEQVPASSQKTINTQNGE
jgi:hypothetical protein